MSIVSAYLNQTAILGSESTKNDYGEATYTETPIKCRFEYNRKIVRDKAGVEVVSEAYVWTEIEVKDTDIIIHDKSWPVINVNKCVDIGGKFSHYEVRL